MKTLVIALLLIPSLANAKTTIDCVTQGQLLNLIEIGDTKEVTYRPRGMSWFNPSIAAQLNSEIVTDQEILIEGQEQTLDIPALLRVRVRLSDKSISVERTGNESSMDAYRCDQLIYTRIL